MNRQVFLKCKIRLDQGSSALFGGGFTSLPRVISELLRYSGGCVSHSPPFIHCLFCDSHLCTLVHWSCQLQTGTCQELCQVALVVKNPPAKVETRDAGSISMSEDPLEEDMVTHASILAQRILWTAEPGRLQSIGSHRVGGD